MTDLMQSIFDYIQETRYLDHLSQQSYQNYVHLLIQQEHALLETCSDAQWELLEACQATQDQIHCLELEAIFQAAWTAARELA